MHRFYKSQGFQEVGYDAFERTYVVEGLLLSSRRSPKYLMKKTIMVAASTTVVEP